MPPLRDLVAVRRNAIPLSLRLTLGLVLLLFVPGASAIAPAHATAPAAPASAAATAPVAPAGTAMAPPAFDLAAHPLVLPPRTVSAVGNCTNTPVKPGCGYPVEAAPMGIGDFGVSGWSNPIDYAYGTTMFLGTFAWNQAYFYNASLGAGSDDAFTVQLNVVLNFINGAGSGKNYSFWIQDVAVPSDPTPNTLDMSYEDNIWNFSSSAGTMPGGTLHGNGTASTEYYYDVASGTGSADVLAAPNEFQLLVISTRVAGYPVVRFCYKDPTMAAFVCYDSVRFTFAKDVDLDRGFFVDGFNMNPLGLFEDAELTIGGPGGGTYTITQPTTVATETLQFWNGHNFQATPSAWNFGDDTAESTSSDQSIFSQDGSGTPLTSQLNGTARDAIPQQAYRTNEVGGLSMWNPSVPTGTLAVGATDWSYQGSSADLTLVPGTYPVWDNSTSPATSQYLGRCTVTALTTLNITATPCPGGVAGNPLIASFSANPDPVSLDTATTLNVSASGGTGKLFYTYTGLPPGCASSGLAQFICSPSAVGTYHVTVFVNDSASGHASQTDLLTVELPPVDIASFAATPDPVVIPDSATLQVSASTTLGALHYAYTGLPSGCSSSNTTSLTCSPTAVGSYAVKVFVNSSLGPTAVSSTTLTVNLPPPPVALISASASSLDQGQSVTFTTSASGGVAPLTYSYTGLPKGCTNESTTTLTCAPQAQGTFEVSVVARDAYGQLSAAADVNITVGPPALITGVTLTASPSTFTQGGNTTITVVVSGGTSPFSYSFTGLPTGCSDGSDAASFLCTPSGTGTFHVLVMVTDSEGRVGWANATVTVNSANTSGSGLGGLSTFDWLLVVAVVAVAAIAVAVVAKRRHRSAGAPPPASGAGAYYGSAPYGGVPPGPPAGPEGAGYYAPPPPSGPGSWAPPPQ